MKILTPLLAILVFPLVASAQEGVPPDLAAVEEARSRACVPVMTRLAELNADLEPFGTAADRLRQIDQAIALEDSTGIGPWAADNPLEQAVRQWFVEDAALASRYLDSRDEAVQEERTAAREAVRARLRTAMDSIRAAVDARMTAAGDLEAGAQACEGAIFVRPVVAEACATESGPLCDAVGITDGTAPFRFVDSAADLWDVEELRPWTDPGPLQGGPGGAIGGGRSAAQVRLGNISVVVGVSPLIRNREQLTAEEITAFDDNLDSLGIEFDHPRLAMAPALELQARVPAPIGGETHYLLHFGDMSGDDDLVWDGQAGDGELIQAIFPASGLSLQRLASGEALSFTAVAVPEGVPEGEVPEATPVYSLTVNPVNQVQAVRSLLGYMVSGALSRDLRALVPAEG